MNEIKQSRVLKLSAAVIATGSVVGRSEHSGPLGDKFDLHDPEDRFGEDTWEKAESEMQRIAFSVALKKSGLSVSEIGAIYAGDLLNQCVGSAYGLIDFDIPYYGLYGACSTSAEGLMLASMTVSGGFFDRAAAVTSSHNCSAERQYRTPIEYGGQKPPTAQWTVTGAGAFIVGRAEDYGGEVRVSGAIPGIVVDGGITDANNMGAAMAPAAMGTLLRYFDATGDTPSDFDLILTGDLGEVGGGMLIDLMKMKGIDISKNYDDCGRMIYRGIDHPDVNAGGSGCGCAASVMAAHIIPEIKSGVLKRVLFLATGAMMSPSSIQQGLSIPSVAHGVVLEAPRN